MTRNLQARRNPGSDQATDNIEEKIWRLNIEDSPDKGNGEPDCIHYLRTGHCDYGNNCRFNHPSYRPQGAQLSGELPERIGQPDCGFFLKTGTCKYGPTCKYHHPKDRRGAAPVSFNSLGLPMRQGEKSCPYYMRTGYCKFGVGCKFHHPQPASLQTSLPASGPLSIYGPMASTVVPSSGLPYSGGQPVWPLPRVPYQSGPHVQGQQSYMPIVFSPTQGVFSAQGWIPYMVRSLSALDTSLPERPDQPECRYFIDTGTCRYGSDCKYHHPKERIQQAVTNNISPYGLPLRPGQAVCSNYNTFGMCNYGVTCKFDHPFAACCYQYGLSMPALPIVGGSLLNCQRNIPGDNSSEPSKLSRYTELSKSDAGSKKRRKDEKISEVVSSRGDGSELVSSPPPSEIPQDQPH